MDIRHPPPRKCRIGLTPLIDVVFILLLFFMLASSFLDWRAIGLNMPGEGGDSSDGESPVIRLGGTRTLYVNGESVTLEKLGERIRPFLARDADSHLLVQPETGVPLQRIVTVLDRLSAAGGRNISLVRDAGRGQ